MEESQDFFYTFLMLNLCNRSRHLKVGHQKHECPVCAAEDVNETMNTEIAPTSWLS